MTVLLKGQNPFHVRRALHEGYKRNVRVGLPYRHCTPNHLRLCRLLEFPSRATPIRWHGKGPDGPPPGTKNGRAWPHCKRFLRQLAVPLSLLQPVSVPAAPSYPVGKGSAQILRKSPRTLAASDAPRPTGANSTGHVSPTAARLH